MHVFESQSHGKIVSSSENRVALDGVELSNGEFFLFFFLSNREVDIFNDL